MKNHDDIGRGIGRVLSEQSVAKEKIAAAAVSTNKRDLSGIPLSSVRDVVISDLTDNPNNEFPQFGDNEFENLKRSLLQNGMIHPITVANDRKTIIDGHNRFHAAQQIGMETVPVRYVLKPLSVDEETRLGISGNVDRRHLSSSEQSYFLAKAYPGYFEKVGTAGRKPKELAHSEPITQKEIAESANISVAALKRHKKVHETAKEIARENGSDKVTKTNYEVASIRINKTRKKKPGEKQSTWQHEVESKQKNQPAAEQESLAKALTIVLDEAASRAKVKAAKEIVEWIRLECAKSKLLN